MPLKKLLLKPGVNRENTRYTSEGGWYESDNIRFRQGTPEKLGGWTRISPASYLGLARSLLNWITLTSQNLVGVGTHLKFYIENGGGYNDITPLRATTSAGDVTFSAVSSTLDGAINASITTITLADTSGFPAAGKIIIESEVIDYSAITSNTLTGCTRGASSLVSGTSTSTTAATHSDTTAVGCFSVTIADSSHGASTGDFVTYSGAASLGGNIIASMLNQEYQIENVIDANNYVIIAKSFSSESITSATYTNIASTSSDSGNGGGSVVGAYQINSGASSANPLVGWGAAGWGAGAWGQGEADTEALRVWSQQNFGEDLIFAHRNGAIFYWDASDAGGNLNTRAVGLTTLSGASNVPTVTNNLLVSDINRFCVLFWN